MAKILSIKDLHVNVANTPIINGLNLEIESGET
ncbi:MAG TPA: ABC transporter ATP-binding protein, partial [Gammaproteobacteria bacterium]|nr:ABC transporter ATP-binding protein [Gammaproteobacteria bacterium]